MHPERLGQCFREWRMSEPLPHCSASSSFKFWKTNAQYQKPSSQQCLLSNIRCWCLSSNILIPSCESFLHCLNLDTKLDVLLHAKYLSRKRNVYGRALHRKDVMVYAWRNFWLPLISGLNWNFKINCTQNPHDDVFQASSWPNIPIFVRNTNSVCGVARDVVSNSLVD